MEDLRKIIKSGCETSGHCKEHKPCCYCLEAERIVKEVESQIKSDQTKGGN